LQKICWKTNIGINVPIGKGEAKSINKSVIIEKWQSEWEAD